MFEIVAIFTP